MTTRVSRRKHSACSYPPRATYLGVLCFTAGPGTFAGTTFPKFHDDETEVPPPDKLDADRFDVLIVHNEKLRRHAEIVRGVAEDLVDLQAISICSLRSVDESAMNQTMLACGYFKFKNVDIDRDLRAASVATFIRDPNFTAYYKKKKFDVQPCPVLVKSIYESIRHKFSTVIADDVVVPSFVDPGTPKPLPMASPTSLYGFHAARTNAASTNAPPTNGGTIASPPRLANSHKTRQVDTPHPWPTSGIQRAPHDGASIMKPSVLEDDIMEIEPLPMQKGGGSDGTGPIGLVEDEDDLEMIGLLEELD